MKRSSVQVVATSIFAAILVVSLAGCGGGGSSGGSSSSTAGQSGGGGGGISLVSITFPEYTDLSGGSQKPPVSAPLSQQVVLTFSGAVQGNVSTQALEIYADPGLNYSGPKAALDSAKYQIPAKGTMEVMNNIAVFTPFIPIDEIDLSSNALPPNIPGLLPGYTYHVFVPVGTQGAVENLMSVEPGVTNPIDFTTGISESTYFNFRNQPALPPKVVSVVPADGTVDFPINTFSDMTSQGFPEWQDIVLELDQPIDFGFDNLEGVDMDGDGVREQNLFLKYSDSLLYSAVDQYSIQQGFLAALDSATDEFKFIGYTNHQDLNVGLKEIVLLNPLNMVGCSGSALYDVDFLQEAGVPLVVGLDNMRALSNGAKVSCLAHVGGTMAYALDLQGSTLLTVDLETGETEIKGVLTSGFGNFVDLAVGLDNQLYGLRVYDAGTINAVASIERINTSTLVTVPIAAGLKGDFVSFDFSRNNAVTLFEYNERKLAYVDLNDPLNIQFGDAISYPLLMDGRRLQMNHVKYELGVTPDLLQNSYHGATVQLDPSGILPMGAWLDLMVRASFTNVSGGSMASNYGHHPQSAMTVSTFRTYEPQPAKIEDVFSEDFLDNTMEDRSHGLPIASAIWNVQDADGLPPDYSGLLAAIGLGGAGELGDFVPIGITPTVFLDTNYQPLPMYDGSTPDISTPVVVTDGVFHFKNIVIPYNVTVSAQGSNPLVFTATGKVEIAGIIDVSGQDGTVDTTFNSAYVPTPGGKGGPGAGRGGMGQPPIPPNFTALTQLQSPPRGERGWGPGDILQIGGDGGESGAKGTNVPWGGSAKDKESRGAGGGGGSFFQPGHDGYPGYGQYGITEDGTHYIRDTWDYWDGTYSWEMNWQPDPGFVPPTWTEWSEEYRVDIYGGPLPGQPKENYYSAMAPDPNPNKSRAPHHGDRGNLVFQDGDPSNDFYGEFGELKTLIGGQGGGGGGTRMDSMNPETINQAAQWNPPLAPSAYDSKGGGGGGGGGAMAIHALDEIRIRETGKILARGGQGGGGEVIGHSNFGGSGGGGSGGAIILNSATSIVIEYTQGTEPTYGVLDVTGGWGADARGNVNVSWKEIPNTCQLNSTTGKLANMGKGFCSWSRCDGGYGGYGLIQLMVPDPGNDIDMIGWPSGAPEDRLSVEAQIVEVQFLPESAIFPYGDKYEEGTGDIFSLYTYEAVGPKPYVQVWPKTTDCLVDPYKTPSTINAKTFAISKWIDTGRIMDRSPINGLTPPVFYGEETDSYFGFRGVELGALEKDGVEDWAMVETVNGYVVAGDNDIDVNAPDVPLAGYIPSTNNVAVKFQGADALMPGSKVPDLDGATEWTTELSSLQGKQFIRFMVGFNVAYGTEIAPDSLKPQVNNLRIRMKY